MHAIWKRIGDDKWHDNDKWNSTGKWCDNDKWYDKDDLRIIFRLFKG